VLRQLKLSQQLRVGVVPGGGRRQRNRDLKLKVLIRLFIRFRLFDEYGKSELT